SGRFHAASTPMQRSRCRANASELLRSGSRCLRKQPGAACSNTPTPLSLDLESALGIEDDFQPGPQLLGRNNLGAAAAIRLEWALHIPHPVLANLLEVRLAPVHQFAA